MANSPLVSLRVPPETLERIDQLAEKLYPARRSGRSANRSQVILDAIEQFLESYDSDGTDREEIMEEKIDEALQQYHQQIEKEIKRYIDDKFLAYAYNLEQRLHNSRKTVHHRQTKVTDLVKN